MPKVGICIVDFDSGAHLRECLASLQGQPVASTAIVFNGHDESRRFAGRNTHGLHPKRNLGYGAGANLGVAVLEDAEYVVVCNPDVRFGPGSISTLCNALDTHRDVGIVGPEVLEPGDTRYSSGRRFPGSWWMIVHMACGSWWHDNPGTRRYHMADRNRTSFWTPEWISGAAFMVRRDCWDKLSGFDERFFMYMEDVDLCHRASAAGWHVAIEPAAEVMHLGGGCTGKKPFRAALWHTQSGLKWVRKSRGPGLYVAAWLTFPIVLFLRTLKAVVEARLSVAGNVDGGSKVLTRWSATTDTYRGGAPQAPAAT